jgi:transcriptional regulator with XRE-family HTH domain
MPRPKKPPKPKLRLVKMPSVQALKIAERDREVLKLRNDGMEYRDIAEKLGITQAKAGEIVRDAIREIPEEDKKVMRALSEARFNRMLLDLQKTKDDYLKDVDLFHATYTKEGKCADPKQLVAIQAQMLEIERDRARLFGLNAPVKVEGAGAIIGVGINDILRMNEAVKANHAPIEGDPQLPV